jgi:hypothetical protein
MAGERVPGGWLIAGAVLSLLSLCAFEAPAQAPKRVYSERDVQIAFLFNFTQFVQWPPAALAGTEGPFVIGILGRDPFGATLDQVLRGEKAHGREIVVERYQRVEDVKCHLLFISRSESGELERLVGALDGRPILTVGDADGFGQRGGMMRLFTENSRMRLQVNLKAARRAGLTISSNLLRVAHIIDDEGGR